MVVSKTVAQEKFPSVLRDVPGAGVGMLANVHRLCPADLPSKVLICLGRGFFIGEHDTWMPWQLKAEVCLALGLCWAFQSTLFPGVLLRVLLRGSLMGQVRGYAVAAVAFGECYMKHTRDGLWVYSEHSLKTKGLGKPGEAPRGAGVAVAVCPVLGTQLDTVSRRDRGREKCYMDMTSWCYRSGKVKMTQFHFYFYTCLF